MEKKSCNECGTLVLSSTFNKHKGLCALCARGIKKTICDTCKNQVSVPLKQSDGTKLCLKCSMQLSQPIRDLWKKKCDLTNNVFSLEGIEIIEYPDFTTVFENEELKGIYHPLCSVKIKKKKSKDYSIFHIVSHNGVWLNDENNTGNPNEEYSIFKISQNKYQFNGDLSRFKGYELIKDLFNFLTEEYNKKLKLTSEEFINHIISTYPIDISSFDYLNYIETFYYFNEQKPKKNNGFEPFNKKKFISIGEELILNNKELITLVPIGVCWSEHYFQDGNSIFLFYEPEQNFIYCVNQYS